MKTVLKNTIANAMPNNEVRSHQTPIAVENPIGGLKNKIKNTKNEVQNYQTPIAVVNPIGGLKKLVVFVLGFILFTSCKMNRDVTTICPPPESVQAPAIQYAPATISGTVTDKEGAVQPDVAVLFDFQKIGTTDANGKFSYTASKRIDKNYTITFTKEGFNNTSKSYHTSMGAMDYAIQMGKPCKCDSSIIDNFCSCLQPISFDWTSKTVTENQTTLNEIIQCLKTNPACNITIEYQIADTKRAAPARVATIKKYFVNKGISEARINTITNPNTTVDTNKLFIYKQ